MGLDRNAKTDHRQRRNWQRLVNRFPRTTGSLVLGDGSGFDTLGVGTDTHVLTADSSEPLGVKWASVGSLSSPLTTKGDVYTYSTTTTRLPVGANGQVITADSSEVTGLKWVEPGSLLTGGDGVNIAINSIAIDLEGTGTDSGLGFNSAELYNFGLRSLSADPGSPSDGQLWWNTTDTRAKGSLNSAIIEIGGLAHVDPTSSSAVANTASKTAFDNSYTIPANSMYVNRVIRFRASGSYSRTGSSPTLAIRVEIGGTVVASFGSSSTAASGTWFIDGYIVCTTAGASGATRAAGNSWNVTGGTARPLWYQLDAGPIDFTTAQDLEVTAQWSVADPANTTDMDLFVVEFLN